MPLLDRILLCFLKRKDVTDEVKASATNPENLITCYRLTPFKWNLLELRVFCVVDDLLLGPTAAGDKTLN